MTASCWLIHRTSRFLRVVLDTNSFLAMERFNFHIYSVVPNYAAVLHRGMGDVGSVGLLKLRDTYRCESPSPNTTA